MNSDELTILWTNDDPITAELMVMMYATNTKKRDLWDRLTVFIWGATSKLVAENTHIQALIDEAKDAGVIFKACQACAENLGTKEKLESLGIEVEFLGGPLTKVIKTNGHLITV